MKGIKFYKMQGTGNDFVVFNKKDLDFELQSDQIRLVCDRNYGIGCDQLLVFDIRGDSTMSLSIYNQDGSRAANCGNGLRCVALLAKIIHDLQYIKIDIAGGNTSHAVIKDLISNTEGLVYVDLGSYTTSITEKGYIVQIGNTHLVVTTDNIRNTDMSQLEYLSKTNDMNVSSVEYNDDQAKVLVYERGSGITNACGSAAAAVHIANFSSLNDETTIQFMNSGEKIRAGTVPGSSNIYIIGDAKLVYDGIFYLN